MEFPRMLYRLGGDWQLESGKFSLRTVASEEEHAAALAEGWHADQYAAKEAAAPAPVADDAPPTRAELEQKAAELGIKVDKRLGDAKLAALIAEKLKA